ncbi:tyrosine-type recombinase/integrase [Rubellimicrobium mesophilum]|uniref:tyrosine-type recombinase/integrase n=1 Tax=Rubellimicrobium mesophilum TaxID=1123067 RepID=UPI00146FD66A|nr:integrase family protein [Rubellimicrobium mesophilum]
MNEKKAADLRPRAEGYEVRDEVVPGLVLRVGKKGTKVWDVVVQTGPKSRKRVRLGTFPSLSVKDARKAAETIKENSIGAGRAREVRTVGELFERYAAARAPQMRSWHDVQSVWHVWGEPRLARVRLSDLSIHHGLDLRDHVALHSSPLRAASVIRYLRPMFAWAADERIIDVNPWATLKAREKAPARERVLSPSEWQALWEAARREPYPFGPFLKVLMLSAQRLSNVAQMRWDELHGDLWIIPREKMKATRTAKAAAHEVPLSSALAALIAEQPRLGPYVFTTRGDRPISPGSRQKDRFTAAVNAAAAQANGRPLLPQEVLADWRFHDIRRTAATLMTGGGVSRFIVERVLGHADRGVTAIYDRNIYRTEKRAALEVLAATVDPSHPTSR